MFSLCSINSDGGERSQIPATPRRKAFRFAGFRRSPTVRGEREREREILEQNIEFWRKKI